METKDKLARIISVKDYSQLSEIYNDGVIITATQNLKRNNLFNGAKSIMSFSDLINSASKNIDNKKSLNSTEFRYIIHKTIEEIFEPEKARTYQNCVTSLEDLFIKLLLNDIRSNKISDRLFKNYSFVEKDIFEIYKNVVEKLNRANQKTFKEMVVSEACMMLSQYPKVVFVGFVFLNNLQEAIIKGIECPELTFINKDNNFITEELLTPLMNQIGRTCEVVKVEKESNNHFKEIENNLFTKNTANKDFDGQIEIYEPFSNREEEFLFIAKQISQSIRQKNLKPNEIENELQNYAVVLTKDKNELSKTLNDAFGQFGIFIPNEKKYKNLKPVYYSKQEFLNDNILQKNIELSYIEKIQLFDKFKRIKVLGDNVQYEDFPIGRFVFEVYKVVAHDLTIDSFKVLINTQWYLNKTVDSVAIQDFYKLEAFFENLTTLEQWKKEVSNLIALKKQISKEIDFDKHPLYVIKDTSLKYIKDYLEFIGAIVENLKVNGNIKFQVKNLLQTFNLINLKLPNKEEQDSLQMFVDILNGIESNNTEIDYKYFAEHIKELIDQYSWAKQMDSKALRLPVVNMENYTKYDYVFFPMFEDNKYPRILKLDFPYTENMVQILNTLGVQLQKNQDMEYHLKMSRHIFKNVFGFTNKKIIFTYTTKENGSDLAISLYANDIFNTLGKDIEFSKINQEKELGKFENRELVFKDTKVQEVGLNELIGRFMCPKLFYYETIIKNQICYKDSFLMNFYAKALITNRVFTNLAKTGKEYELNNNFDEELEMIFEISCQEILKYFDFFGSNAIKDIKITSKKSVSDFVELHFKQGKFAAKHFKFRFGKEKVIKGKFVVKTRPTLIMVNLDKQTEVEFDISKNLDYLVASCGGKKYDFKHYDEIIERLDRGGRNDDKMALVNFASFKVNTQLNNEKYYNDGVVRVNRLISDTPNCYSNMNENISSYCRFCKMKSICKGVLIDD